MLDARDVPNVRLFGSAHNHNFFMVVDDLDQYRVALALDFEPQEKPDPTRSGQARYPARDGPGAPHRR